MSERDEQVRRIAEGFPGPRGPQGATGATGRQGVAPGVAWAVILLFLISVALIVVGYVLLHRVETRINATEDRVTQAVRVNNHERCSSIAKIVGIPVPVPTFANPSRMTWAKFSLIERHRGTQLGCDMPPPTFVRVKPGG